MKITPIKTDDGSDSLYLEHLDEHYHSTKGAIQESKHIFINAGLLHSELQFVSILEVGMGTGLNILLTILAAKKNNLKITYTTLEKHPLTIATTSKLNYPKLIGNDSNILFKTIHESAWNIPVQITPNFMLHKVETDLLTWKPKTNFDLVYFDAFSPDKQPEMWQTDIYKKIYNNMNENGTFVTYSAKGNVRRGLEEVGFTVKRLPGPPGKTHITQAKKSSQNSKLT